MTYEIITPDSAEEAKTDVPDPTLNQVHDGVESPIELSKQDRMIKTKVEYYFDLKWIEKVNQVRDKWKNILYGAGSTVLVMISAYLGRVTA